MNDCSIRIVPYFLGGFWQSMVARGGKGYFLFEIAIGELPMLKVSIPLPMLGQVILIKFSGKKKKVMKVRR